MDLPELGVGLIYSSALESLLIENPELIDVLEIEPQTTWVQTHDRERPFHVREEAEEHLARLPGRKLVHSVGTDRGRQGASACRPNPFAAPNRALLKSKADASRSRLHVRHLRWSLKKVGAAFPSTMLTTVTISKPGSRPNLTVPKPG